MVEFVDEEEDRYAMPTQGERIIWKLYKWGAIVVPLVLMLTHWYVFYLFSQNTHEVLDYPEVNEFCIAWLYTLVYLVLPSAFLPATFLFRWCNLFRVPFVYFIFINVERWYYGSWFCTNEMVDSHYILIYCTICIYVAELLGVWWRYRKELPDILKAFFITSITKARGIFHGKATNVSYDEVMRIMEERTHDKA